VPRVFRSLDELAQNADAAVIAVAHRHALRGGDAKLMEAGLDVMVEKTHRPFTRSRARAGRRRRAS